MDFIEVSAKNVDDAITEASIQLGTTSDNIEYEVVEKGSTGFLGIGSKNAVIKARKKFSLEGNVRNFLDSVFAAMNMEVEVLIKIDEEEHSIDVELKGDDMGILIGKRGQTLDSIQYLSILRIITRLRLIQKIIVREEKKLLRILLRTLLIRLREQSVRYP